MILDMQEPTLQEGMIIFPDWVFANLPLQPSQLVETEVIQGGAGSESMSITGSIDSPEI